MAKDHVWLSDPILEVPSLFASLWFNSHLFLPCLSSHLLHWLLVGTQYEQWPETDAYQSCQRVDLIGCSSLPLSVLQSIANPINPSFWAFAEWDSGKPSLHSGGKSKWDWDYSQISAWTEHLGKQIVITNKFPKQEKVQASLRSLRMVAQSSRE